MQSHLVSKAPPGANHWYDTTSPSLDSNSDAMTATVSAVVADSAQFHCEGAPLHTPYTGHHHNNRAESHPPSPMHHAGEGHVLVVHYISQHGHILVVHYISQHGHAMVLWAHRLLLWLTVWDVGLPWASGCPLWPGRAFGKLLSCRTGQTEVLTDSIQSNEQVNITSSLTATCKYMYKDLYISYMHW